MPDLLAKIDRATEGVARGGKKIAPRPLILLIDHSGPVGDRNMQVAYGITRGFVAFCEGLSLPHEVLGFTTIDWRGGRARADWIRDGRPQQPGRLCALRHIVYREALPERGWLAPVSWQTMFLPAPGEYRRRGADLGGGSAGRDRSRARRDRRRFGRRAGG